MPIKSSFFLSLALLMGCGSGPNPPRTPDAAGSMANASLSDPGVITLLETDAPTLETDAPTPVTLATLPDLPPEPSTTSDPVPGPSTFRIRNVGDRAVYLRRSCGVEVRVSPPQREWTTFTTPICKCDCADLTCLHVDCPGCPAPVIVTLAPGEVLEVTWLPRLGRRRQMSVDGGDPLCASYRTLLPGPYLATLDTYPTPGDANSGMNRREVVTTFALLGTPSIIDFDLP